MFKMNAMRKALLLSLLSLVLVGAEACHPRYAPIPPTLKSELENDAATIKHLYTSGDGETRAEANRLAQKIISEAPGSELAEEAWSEMILKGALDPTVVLKNILAFGDAFPRSQYLNEFLRQAIVACAPLLRKDQSVELCGGLARKATQQDFPSKERNIQALAFFELSRISRNQKDDNRALDMINRALDIDAGQPLFYFEKGKILLETRGADEAKPWILKAAHVDPSHAELLPYLETISASVSDSERPTFLFLTGLVKLRGEQNVPSARATFQKLITLYPDDPMSEQAKSLITGLDYEVHWETDFSKAIQTALQRERRLLLFFYTEWCSDCSIAKSRIFSDLFVKKTLYDLYLPVRIDAEKDRTTSKQFQILRLPTFIILDPKTREVLHREETLMTEKEFDEMLRDYARK